MTDTDTGADSRTDRPSCPVAHGEPFDSRSLAAAIDPEPWLRVAREDSPVFWDDDQQVWFVTRHADVMSVIRDTATYSSRHTNKFKPMTSPVLREVFPDGHPGLHSMLMKDPPEHSRVRRLANQSLTPAVVAELEPSVHARCDVLIDAFAADGRADLAAQFASLLPVQVINDIAGAPPERAADFMTWGQDYFALVLGAPPLDDEAEAALAVRARRMITWLHEFVADRRRAPTGDLTSRLIQAIDDEGEPKLSNEEVIAVLSSLFSAGVETTAIFIPRLVGLLLADDRRRWKELLKDRSGLEGVIEEALRYLNVVRGVRRTATTDTQLAGQSIREGEDLYVLYNSANYDSEVFENPGEFKPDRDRLNAHLAFGKGIHYCIGAPLARMEARVALEHLLDRLPSLRLADVPAPAWRPHTTLPRPLSMHVEWDAA